MKNFVIAFLLATVLNVASANTNTCEVCLENECKTLKSSNISDLNEQVVATVANAKQKNVDKLTIDCTYEKTEDNVFGYTANIKLKRR